jgi:hypothetical protein
MEANPELARLAAGCALTIAIAITSTPAKAAVITSPVMISGITQEQVGYRENCPSHFGGTTIGTGISSLLGKVSLEANDCISSSENDPSFSFIGTMTFTLSSGNEFFAEYWGSFTPTSYPSIFTLTNSFFKITGGTGNFKGATGGGTLQGGENIDTGLGLMQATGTISDFKYSKNYSEPKTAYELMAGSANDPISMIAELNNSLISSPTTPLGQYFSQDQSALLAENTLPESSSWALLGIGLASLATIRRRKPKLCEPIVGKQEKLAEDWPDVGIVGIQA